jgi:hypothetical protein
VDLTVPALGPTDHGGTNLASSTVSIQSGRDSGVRFWVTLDLTAPDPARDDAVRTVIPGDGLGHRW